MKISHRSSLALFCRFPRSLAQFAICENFSKSSFHEQPRTCSPRLSFKSANLKLAHAQTQAQSFIGRGRACEPAQPLSRHAYSAPTQRLLSAILHFIPFHYITLHYITSHCIALHCIALHYIALHYITSHCIALHYIALHYIAFHYITLHYITLHFIPFHFTSLHYTTLHYMT